MMKSRTEVLRSHIRREHLILMTTPKLPLPGDWESHLSTAWDSTLVHLQALATDTVECKDHVLEMCASLSYDPRGQQIRTFIPVFSPSTIHQVRYHL